MARERSPFADRFSVLCLRSKWYPGRGYVDEWVECETRKDNGWYSFYEKVWARNGARYSLGSEVHRPLRWRELQAELASMVQIRPIEGEPEDTEIPDLTEIL